MQERIQSENGSFSEGDRSKKPGVYGARVQKWICGAGGVASVCSSIYASLAPNKPLLSLGDSPSAVTMLLWKWWTTAIYTLPLASRAMLKFEI